MKKLILAIPRRAAPTACFIVLLFAPSHDLSAQSAKPKDKTRVYTIELSQSRITVKITQKGFLSGRYPNHYVEVKNFNGKIEVSDKDETRIAVEVEAEAKSLTNVDEGMTDLERREFHNILNNLVLESDKYPIIKFVSVSISDARKSGDNRTFTLNGDLTLRDSTRRVSFPIAATISKDRLRATGDAEIKQTDFGIRPYSGKLGMIKIGDVVKVNFEIVAKSP
ncbi:MAG: YceI family protein [Chloracidobacterium sp.]|nr:YceI family protein [Chloracidobacterium sp.]